MRYITVEELTNTIKDRGFSGLEIIDVRQPEEYKEWHIKNAKLIPLGTLDARMQDVDWSKQVIFVCRSGARSGMAANIANDAGKQAFNLAGGMIEVESTPAMHGYLEK